MRVVEGHVAAKVAHIGLRVEVRHAQRLHQRGMCVAEFVPRDLDTQPRRNRIQDPVGDILEHMMMAGLRTKHQVVGSDMVTPRLDRKSTRLNSSHLGISYAVFCLKKKNNKKKI